MLAPPSAQQSLQNIVTQKGRVAHLSRSTVTSIWALDVALDDAAGGVGEEAGEIGIGAKSGVTAVPKFVFSYYLGLPLDCVSTLT